MANKLPGSGGGSEKKKRKSESSVGNPKKKERGSNGPASNEKMNNVRAVNELKTRARNEINDYAKRYLFGPHEETGWEVYESDLSKYYYIPCSKYFPFF